MIDITVVLNGGDEMKRALNELQADLRRKVIRGALRDAAKPLVQVARSLAPVLEKPKNNRQRGTMRKNIKSFASKKYKLSQGMLGVYVTVRASKKDLRTKPITGDPYYWRWVAGGHKIVPRKAKGSRVTIRARRRAATGTVAARPFLANAFSAKGVQAKEIFEARIIDRINAANRKV